MVPGVKQGSLHASKCLDLYTRSLPSVADLGLLLVIRPLLRLLDALFQHVEHLPGYGNHVGTKMAGTEVEGY